MDIDITGARILISRPEWGGFMLTETVVVTWVVMLILVLACRFMTAHLEVHPTKKAAGDRRVDCNLHSGHGSDQHGREVRPYLVCAVYRRHVCAFGGMQPFQCGWRLRADKRPFHRSGLGAVCFCADYHHEDQDERLRRLSARLHHADPCDDAV